MKQIAQNYKTGELPVARRAGARGARPGGVLVRTEYSLISTGTELMKVGEAKLSLLGKARARPDQVQQGARHRGPAGPAGHLQEGHEPARLLHAARLLAVRRVVEVGEGVTELSVGQRVACAGNQYALHAEVNWVPVNLCVPVPDGVDPRARRLHHGRRDRHAGPAPGRARSSARSPCVIGLGLIGQLLVQLLDATGVHVVGIDSPPSAAGWPSERARSRAAAPDAPASSAVVAALAALTGGVGADARLPRRRRRHRTSPVELAAELARDRGRVVDIGKCSLDLPWNAYYEKELDVRFSRSYGPGRYDPTLRGGRASTTRSATCAGPSGATWRASSTCSAAGRLDLEPLVSDVLPFDDAVVDLRAADQAASWRASASCSSTRPTATPIAPARPPAGRRPSGPARRPGRRPAVRHRLHRRRQLRLHDAAAPPRASASDVELVHGGHRHARCPRVNAQRKFGFERAATDHRGAARRRRRSTPCSSSPATTRTPAIVVRGAAGRQGGVRREAARARPRSSSTRCSTPSRRPATTGCRSASTAASRRCSSSCRQPLRARRTRPVRPATSSTPAGWTASSWYGQTPSRGLALRAARAATSSTRWLVVRRRSRSRCTPTSGAARRRRPRHARRSTTARSAPSPTRRPGNAASSRRRRSTLLADGQGGPPRQLPRAPTLWTRPPPPPAAPVNRLDKGQRARAGRLRRRRPPTARPMPIPLRIAGGDDRWRRSPSSERWPAGDAGQARRARLSAADARSRLVRRAAAPHVARARSVTRASHQAASSAWRRRQVRAWRARPAGRAGRPCPPFAARAARRHARRRRPAAPRPRSCRRPTSCSAGAGRCSASTRDDLAAPGLVPRPGHRPPGARRGRTRSRIDYRDTEPHVGNVKQRVGAVAPPAPDGAGGRVPRAPATTATPRRVADAAPLVVGGQPVPDRRPLDQRHRARHPADRPGCGSAACSTAGRRSADLFERQPRLRSSQLHAPPGVPGRASEHAARRPTTTSSPRRPGSSSAGCAFPVVPASRRRGPTSGRPCCSASCAAQTVPDGLNRELATEYHGFVLELAWPRPPRRALAGQPRRRRLWRGDRARMTDAPGRRRRQPARPPRQGDGDDGLGLLLDGPATQPVGVPAGGRRGLFGPRVVVAGAPRSRRDRAPLLVDALAGQRSTLAAAAAPDSAPPSSPTPA